MPLRLAFGCLAIIALLGARLFGDKRTVPHLDKLDIKYRRDAAGEIVAVELPKRSLEYHIEPLLAIPTITEIRAPDCVATFDALASLAKLPELTALHLDRLKDADQCVEHLLALKKLHTLSLAGSDLTNAGLNEICKAYPRLRALDVSDTQITNYGLLLISACRDLESVRALNVRDDLQPPGEQGSVGDVAGLPRLKRLVITGVEVRLEDLRLLACNCNLEELLLSFRGPSPALSYLHECNPSLGLGKYLLQGLDTRHSRQNDGVSEIRHCGYERMLAIPDDLVRNVEKLGVFQAKELGFLHRFPSLKELTLHGLVVDRTALARLNSPLKNAWF